MANNEGQDGSVPGRLLKARLPAWVLLVVVLAVGAVLGTLLVMERSSAVDLGDAVGGAEEVRMTIRICNAEVDRREVNPRQAELDLQNVLEDEGATEAIVRVNRRDCPEPGDSEGSE